MLLVLQHQDGRWCAPSIQSGDGLDEDYGERWAEAVCVTLGLPVGSLVPHIVADDADPRTGELITEPVVEADPQPLPVDRIGQLEAQVALLAARAGVSSAELSAASLQDTPLVAKG